MADNLQTTFSNACPSIEIIVFYIYFTEEYFFKCIHICPLDNESSLVEVMPWFQTNNGTAHCCIIRLQFVKTKIAWWRHLMEIFSRLPALCASNQSVTGEFPAQRAVMRRHALTLAAFKWYTDVLSAGPQNVLGVRGFHSCVQKVKN